ncbi:MAG: amidohydrolase family protein, partial [Microbacterium sp.]|uniref:amidohydrolase family protein n=1 Tax=Microbacterium sp. TaxID=51671 RepID=UPI003F970191
ADGGGGGSADVAGPSPLPAAAWQLFSEHEVGALAPGLFADFIVVDRDPLAVAAEELAETVVRATYVAGHLVG